MDNNLNQVPNQNSPPPQLSKKLIIVLLFPLIIAGIGMVLYTSNRNIGFDNRSKAATVPVTVEFNPSNQTVNPGDTFSLGISINTGDDTVTAAELHLSYDPQLQVVSFIKTDYLPITLQDAGFGNGTASLVLGVDPSLPRKGSGILATITFKALSSGTPNIRIDQTTQVAALGKDTNVLTQLPAASQITVQGTVTSNPTPTPTNPPAQCTPPPCQSGEVVVCGGTNCPGGCGSICVIMTPTPTGTVNTHCLPLGNLNCNDKVDIYDYNRMLHDFGTTGANLPADLNDNGRVDLQDYNKLLFNFNKTI